ncbi:MAG: hypothetical protein JWN83_390 [Chitinophagaceae bacterium]|nr:hypothetical protein [Chitinophagaceae bacterium]
MKSLFNDTYKQEVIDRINKLTPDTKPLWGKMRVEQMLAHSQNPLAMALGDKKFKKGLMAFLFGKIGKRQMIKDQPFKKNLPTAPDFIVKNEKKFNEEKEKLISLVERFGKADPDEIAKRPHSFFGKLTADEWNIMQWKHLDHHLRQFGV